MVQDGPSEKRLQFTYKLHGMLNAMESKGTNHIISCVGDGSVFKIPGQDQFEKAIRRLYFDQSKIESFIQQVSQLEGTQEESHGSQK